MSARLQGRLFLSVKRYGKFIVAAIGGGYLMIHLGMTGRPLLGGTSGSTRGRRDLRPRHAPVRRQPPVRLHRVQRRISQARRAPRPRASEISFEDFAADIKRRKTRIPALLNQTSCGQGISTPMKAPAGIHPQATAHSHRSRATLRRHRRSAHRGDCGGWIFHLRLCGCRGPQRFFQFSHRVYQRIGEPCMACKTPIRRVIVTNVRHITVRSTKR
jgi:formamidopyrimidine-DNA glycosylase